MNDAGADAKFSVHSRNNTIVGTFPDIVAALQFQRLVGARSVRRIADGELMAKVGQMTRDMMTDKQREWFDRRARSARRFVTMWSLKRP